MYKPPVRTARSFDQVAKIVPLWHDAQGVLYAASYGFVLSHPEKSFVAEQDGDVLLFRMPPRRRVPSWGDEPGAPAQFPDAANMDDGLILHPHDTESPLTERKVHVRFMIKNGSSVNNSTGGVVVVQDVS